MIVDHLNISQEPTELCEIMAKYGTDKALGWHNYTLVYNELLKPIKDSACNVFELGIGVINSGASLRGWKEYFSKANIFGADILHETLFTEHRIQTYQCDQLDTKSIQKLWNNFKNVEFDFMLEDGLHEYDASINFFEHSFHKLKKGSLYIIEDIELKELDKYDKYFAKAKIKFEQYQIVNFYNPGNTQDNVLIIIKK